MRTWKSGNQPKCLLIQCAISVACGWTKKSTQSPKTMPGTAAIMSTSRMSVVRSPGGAQSVMNSAVRIDSGMAKQMASIATWTVPTITAAMPMMSWLGSHRCSVKKPRP